MKQRAGTSGSRRASNKWYGFSPAPKPWFVCLSASECLTHFKEDKKKREREKDRQKKIRRRVLPFDIIRCHTHVNLYADQYTDSRMVNTWKYKLFSYFIIFSLGLMSRSYSLSHTLRVNACYFRFDLFSFALALAPTVYDVFIEKCSIVFVLKIKFNRYLSIHNYSAENRSAGYLNESTNTTTTRSNRCIWRRVQWRQNNGHFWLQ